MEKFSIIVLIFSWLSFDLFADCPSPDLINSTMKGLVRGKAKNSSIDTARTNFTKGFKLRMAKDITITETAENFVDIIQGTEENKDFDLIMTQTNTGDFCAYFHSAGKKFLISFIYP